MAQFNDLNPYFFEHPNSKDVTQLIDIQAIKAAVKNLVMINYREVPFEPTIGVGITNLLFENMTVSMRAGLQRLITDLFTYHEPRAKLEGLDVVMNPEARQLNVQVAFSIKDQQEVHQIDVALTRVR